MRSLSSFLRNIYGNRDMIWLMAKRDLETRYVGTLGGFLWVIIQPLATILVFWFVFSVGFKAKGPTGAPFILYFICGFIPWLYFSDMLGASSGGVIANAHLVKKIAFPIEVMPIVSLFSGLIIHGILLLIAIVVLVFNGLYPTLYLFQVVYYAVALSVFLVGLSWVLSALNVFHRDVGQIVTVVINLWFWITPIAWVKQIIPHRYHLIFEINPMLYIVNGYRNAMIYHKWIFPDASQSIYFWGVAIACLAIGGLVFRRLKPHFLDAL